MSDEPEKTQKTWAERLREDIRSVTEKKPLAPGEREPPKSPHEQIQERMREIENEKRKKRSDE